MYVLPTWTRTARLVAEHEALQRALGGSIPSVHACYRFTAKLRRHGDVLAACIEKVLRSVRDALPGYGEAVAIDGSDLPAYANGQRYVSRGGKLRERFSDPEATWGHRSAISTRKGGGYYGYKVHAAVCTATGLPVAWQVETGATNETMIAPQLLDAIAHRGIGVQYAVMDRGYDVTAMYDACETRGIRPIIPVRQTGAVKQGKHLPPNCEQGTWSAGSDTKRQASKWRCPTGECTPASLSIKADRLHPLVPRHTARFKALYHQRGAVEREFGRLKHEWALLPLRVRGLARSGSTPTSRSCLGWPWRSPRPEPFPSRRSARLFPSRCPPRVKRAPRRIVTSRNPQRRGNRPPTAAPQPFGTEDVASGP